MSGAGRGRGWLSLVKNAEEPRPGDNNGELLLKIAVREPLASAEPPVPVPEVAQAEPEPEQVPQVPPEYKELIARFRALNENNDGIELNYIERRIVSWWQETCSTAEEVTRSVNVLCDLCLYDIELASKLACFFPLPSVDAMVIHDLRLRIPYIHFLQQCYENREQILKQSRSKFRIYVYLFGKSYRNGIKYRTMHTFCYCEPIIDLWTMLLIKGNSPEDFELFTTERCLTANDITQYSGWNSGNISFGINLRHRVNCEFPLEIRTVLATNQHLDKESKFWLLLALDMINSDFAPLKHEIHEYYKSQLGSTAMNNFPVQEEDITSQIQNIDISVPPLEKFEKPPSGRPILGIGARLSQYEPPAYEYNTNNEKFHKKAKKKKPHLKEGPPELKNNKAFEHDDRFETDYS